MHMYIVSLSQDDAMGPGMDVDSNGLHSITIQENIDGIGNRPGSGNDMSMYTEHVWVYKGINTCTCTVIYTVKPLIACVIYLATIKNTLQGPK